jgi:hypothetical protein
MTSGNVVRGVSFCPPRRCPSGPLSSPQQSTDAREGQGGENGGETGHPEHGQRGGRQDGTDGEREGTWTLLSGYGPDFPTTC